jgi:hypothetical protein
VEAQLSNEAAEDDVVVAVVETVYGGGDVMG